ncbi:MAG: peptide deformylase [Candidatus Rokubacteria bacterium]|nr:peptide deformylase [Candidatus Rokubacteria bacterium]
MAILKVARLGHPVLRRVAAPVPVPEIRRPETQRLIDDMIETMREYNGAGLAATQVHALEQIAVIEVLANPRYPDAPQIPLTVIINPIVTPLSDAMEEGWEGCLSIPDLRGMVPRHTAVRLQAYDRGGEPVDLIAKDFFARVIQHESDHLNGVVFLDRMKDLSTLTHLVEWNKYWHERRWRDRAGGAGCSPHGAARSGPPSSRPPRAARRSGEWVTEPDPRGLRPATGPARYTRLCFVNNAS